MYPAAAGTGTTIVAEHHRLIVFFRLCHIGIAVDGGLRCALLIIKQIILHYGFETDPGDGMYALFFKAERLEFTHFSSPFAYFCPARMKSRMSWPKVSAFSVPMYSRWPAS